MRIFVCNQNWCPKFWTKYTSSDLFPFILSDAFILAWLRIMLKWHVLSTVFDKLSTTPSEKKIPISPSSREKSGISPKRHGLRILLNESYLSMYNTKYRRHRLHVHFEFCYLQKSTPFTFYVITRDDGPPRPWTPAKTGSWGKEEEVTDPWSAHPDCFQVVIWVANSWCWW